MIQCGYQGVVGVVDLERVRALLEQALGEAQMRDANRITELHLTLYDSSPQSERALRDTLAELSADTLAESARVIISLAPSRFICWNCCGLRFESDDPEAMCPNCGDLGALIPPDILFALEGIEIE